jgi:hypothetical protein
MHIYTPCINVTYIPILYQYIYVYTPTTHPHRGDVTGVVAKWSAGEASAPQAEKNSGKVVGGQGNEPVFA